MNKTKELTKALVVKFDVPAIKSIINNGFHVDTLLDDYIYAPGERITILIFISGITC